MTFRKTLIPFLLAGLALTPFAAAARTADEDLTPLRQLPKELIVLLDDMPSSPTPEAVVESAAARRPLPAGLDLGAPSGARLVIPPADRSELGKSPAGDRLLRYIVLEYRSAGELETIKAALARHPHVLWVGYNWTVEVSATPNDPLFPVSLSPATHQWGLHSLKMPDAWDYNKGRAYVGVIDLGIDATHPDLQTYTYDGSGNLQSIGGYRRQLAFDYAYPADNCSASPGLDCAGQPSRGCADEGQAQIQGGACRTVVRAGHGTHVAGLVAAATNNATGMSGACWNCSLIVSKVGHLANLAGIGWANAGSTQANVVAGINGSLQRGAQVLNMSLGWRPSGGGEVAPNCTTNPSHILCAAMDFVEERDVVLAAAVGNDDSPTVDFPASDPRAIGVGGITSTGAFWDDCPSGSECASNYFSGQIVAPAKQILSTFYRGLYYSGAGSVCPGFDPYGVCTGTSMASPQIAGASGVLRSANPLISAANVKYLLSNNLDNPPGWNTAFGYGKPHVGNAVKAALGKSAGAQLPNRLTPLFRLYSNWAEDFLYTSVPQMAAAAIRDSGNYVASGGPAVPFYPEFPGAHCSFGPCIETPSAEVYVFTGDRAPFTGALPLVPLYRLTYRGTNPNGNANHRDSTYTTELPGVKAFASVGYDLDGIEGYIFQKCTPEPSCMPAGTVRLLRRYHPTRDDFAIFPESQLAAMEGLGYTSTGGAAPVLGYVYPNTDSDGDHLIDGFETVAGTNANLADSDCDGVGDGQELLHFGTSGYGDPLSSPGCTAPLASQFYTQMVPATMTANRIYDVSVSFRNIGSQAWSPVGATPQCGVFRLGSANPQDNVTWGPMRANLSAAVPPGGTAKIEFQVVAPATAGTYNFQWQMLQECGAWFGPASTNVVVNVLPAPAKDAQFVAMTFPVGSLRVGETYPVSLRVRNVGSTAWNLIGPQCGAFRLGAWNPVESTVWGATRHELPATVPPRGEVTVNFDITAPATKGVYNFQRRMVHECFEWFGDTSRNVSVNVKD